MLRLFRKSKPGFFLSLSSNRVVVSEISLLGCLKGHQVEEFVQIGYAVFLIQRHHYEPELVLIEEHRPLVLVFKKQRRIRVTLAVKGDLELVQNSTKGSKDSGNIIFVGTAC